MASRILCGFTLCVALGSLPISAAMAADPANQSSVHESYTLDTPVGQILADPQARAVIKQYAPTVLKAGDNPMGRQMSLRQIQPYSNELTDDTMSKISTALSKLNTHS